MKEILTTYGFEFRSEEEAKIQNKIRTEYIFKSIEDIR